MHELGIVFHIIRTVEDVARQNDVARIQRVTLQLGEVSGVVDCGRQYPTVQFGRTCPHCQSPRTHLVQGNEMLIKEVEAVESAAPAAEPEPN